MVIVLLMMAGAAGYLAYTSAQAAKNPAAATGVGKFVWRLMRKQPA